MKATSPATAKEGSARVAAMDVIYRRFGQRDAWVLAALLLWCAPAARADQYGDFCYTVDGNGATITNCTGSGGTVIISDIINGAAFTCLGNRSFQCRSSLTNVIGPDSVLSIGYQVFIYCRGLTHPRYALSPISVTLWPMVKFLGRGMHFPRPRCDELSWAVL